jgi:redox-sensitive bicupin YhaK (pirin superfamily)
MPITHILPPHIKELSPGFNVRRSLPAAALQSIGPFLFFDHFGPLSARPGDNHDVRPHPHIGLATVTYLFEGALDHRDSIGSFQRIEPGAINWMTAGAGIVHSERTPPDLARTGWRSHGLQLWVGLPRPFEEAAPSFQHVPASRIPLWLGDGVKAKVLIGELHQQRSPVTTFSRTLYLDIDAAPRSTFVLPARMESASVERGCYSVDNAIEVDGVELPPFTLAALETGKDTAIRAPLGARYVVIGGEPLDGRRHMWWNFVSSSRERIEVAKQAWTDQAMGQVPGETEWIPLPLPLQ